MFDRERNRSILFCDECLTDNVKSLNFFANLSNYYLAEHRFRIRYLIFIPIFRFLTSDILILCRYLHHCFHFLYHELMNAINLVSRQFKINFIFELELIYYLRNFFTASKLTFDTLSGS